MNSNKIPSYHFFRIFILSFIMLYMMVGPISSYLMMKELPSMIASNSVDSNIFRIDTNGTVNFQGLDSVIAAKNHSSAHLNSGGTDVSLSIGNTSEMELNIGVDPSMVIYFLMIAVMIIFNIPFKRYLNKKRKGKPISEKHTRFVKKYLISSPVINASFIFIFFLIGIIKSIIIISESHGNNSAEAGLHSHLLIISLFSSVLITLFGYFWFRHRVRYKYIEHVYSNEELNDKLKRIHEPRLKIQLYLIHGITTFLPITVILTYIFISLSTPDGLGIDRLSPQQIKILIGSYADLLPENMLTDGSLDFLVTSFYINSFDAFMASIGILSSFIVSIVYVLMMTRWFAIQITTPMKSLLQNMESASDKKEYSHSLIRTGDELGKLTAGYNLMSDKIKNYIGEIEEMNRDLEKKVVERTIEIQNQKNEIEAQRDEIEAQRDEIQAQRDTVMKQKERIEEIHEEQTSSIRYAQRIQQAMLPSLNILSESGLEHFVLYRPRDIVSGDFYWVARIGSNIIIAVADCTGHGVPGAFMSMLGMTYLKEIVIKDNILQPDRVLNRLRDEIVRSLKQEAGTDQRDGMDIALCTINLDTLELQFAGANNPLYIVTGCSSLVAGDVNQKPETRNQELIEVKGDKMPIGIHERMDVFTLYTNNLQKGDYFYLFSDGIADQFGGPAGKKFKYKQLKEMLLELNQVSMTVQKERIAILLDEWMKEFDQVDDITILGISI